MNIQTEVKTADNGVDVEALYEIKKALTDMPPAAQFTWRASCEWLGGVHSKSTVEGFFGAGAEQSHKAPYSVEADHPGVFAAPDNAATPVEIVLSALASCLTGGVAAVAQHRGIQLHSVKAQVEGDMNLHGILGIDADVRNGFSAIRVTFEVEADASKDEIAAVIAQSQKRSAVFDIVTNPGNVKVALA
ncbi:MAG TPA: OsmC family protein [Amaricoccus sp.]|uniref:OsmC family protein n=1 Tax=Amaricoccus sp. TaxID=1872485 RepID=UPI001E125192|nr:OsmC family protein [Amaricoccus sp.]MCB1403324.1 OsmC family protein [Paracoccaceae bacterium]HPG21943.1 OsmC family protein [Amaricoccus sp.]HRW14108.1 OsmC family protein [Amaricoccus sp.]